MMKWNDWFQRLRILGIVLLIIGIFMPWFQLGFEPQPTPIRWSGFEDIVDSGSLGVQLMLEDGLDLYTTFSLLEGLSGIGLITYFFYSIVAVRRVYKGNKMLSIFLIGISGVFVFNSQSPIIGGILFGFWFFIMGLLVSAIVEWLSSNNFAEDKSKLAV